jgi:uncharacterized protein YecE (DUF72 family)
MAGRILVGISGWRYAPWRGVFYPKGLAQHRELAFASRQLPTIEINGTFYGMLKPSSFLAWDQATPPGFVFSVKAHRYITHLLRLKDAAEPLARFLGSGPLALGPKLGPILWQFPPSFKFNPERLETFFKLLPHDTAEALHFVRRMGGLQPGGEPPRGPARPLRHAMEIRHESFRDEDFISLLRKHKVALVTADTAGKWPQLEELTTDFVYLRLHGDVEIYRSGYSGPALDRWAQRITLWSRGKQPADAKRVTKRPPPARASRDVYCYFDNDVKVKAPYDARELNRRLGLGQAPEEAGIHTGLEGGRKPELGPRARGRQSKERLAWEGLRGRGKKKTARGIAGG